MNRFILCFTGFKEGILNEVGIFSDESIYVEIIAVPSEKKQVSKLLA